MADPYSGGALSSRAIYPSRSKQPVPSDANRKPTEHQKTPGWMFVPYIGVLVASKFFRSFGLFLSYDILKLLHLVQFLFIIKAGSSVCLVFLQKPFSSGKRLTKHQWFRVGRHALLGIIISLLWLFGLTLCGPLRTLLLYEHSDLAVVAGASAIFTNAGGPAKFRGAVFFLVAVMGLLLFDHDEIGPDHHGDQPHPHSSIITHLFEHVTNLTGLSDHKGGVVLLFGTLCLHVGYNSAAKKLSIDIGGAKRLHALSTFVSTILLLPWALLISVTRETQVTSWVSMVIPMVLVILFVFVVDYYIEAACVNRLELFRTSRFGSMAVFISAMVLACFWNHPFVAQVTTLRNMKEVIAEEHMLSGGVIFSFILLMFATHILTSATKGVKGSFVGYSAAGLPLYNFTGDALQRTSQSLLLIAKNGLRQILEESDSRKIFYFLCINLSFTFVELIYGVWTNSLGLISDGFHMLFDCSALVMGLYAAVMSRWKATRRFSYGYDRVEILSGFINGLFLVVIAFFVFSAALTRIVDPPEIKTERLLTVSVIGLCVNLFGILAFRHGHSHGGQGHSHGGHGHSHGGHGHSHGGHSHGSHGHSHGGHGHSHGGHGHSSKDGAKQGQAQTQLTHNTNMQGVFLHVLADTLGSVGVIVSTLLIENFGLKIADPICSLFIALLIFMSVAPLVKETSLILLLRTPEEMVDFLSVALQKVLAVDGILSYRDEHFWRHSSSVICGTLHVQVRPDASEQNVISQVSSVFKEAGVHNITVQVEKETYFQHMSGLGVTTDQVYEMTRNMRTLNHESAANFIKAI